jgi:ProP effector
MNSHNPLPNPAQLARALLNEWQQRFPVFRDCLPLAVGVDKALRQRMPELDRKVLRIALSLHTHSTRYLKGMAKATVRFDLDGCPGDGISDAHRAHAEKLLRERSQKAAAERQVKRDAEVAQRQADLAERRRAEKLDQLVDKFRR